MLLQTFRINISIWATAHLPLPNPTLTLNCCQLTVVELGEGWVGSCPDTDIDPTFLHSNFNMVTNWCLSQTKILIRRERIFFS